MSDNKIAITLNNKLTPDDTFNIIHQEIVEKGLTSHALDSMNDFYNVGVEQIMTKVFDIDTTFDNERDKTPADKSIAKIRFQVQFSNISLKAPITAGYCSGKDKILTPNIAHIEDRTYSSNLYTDATIKAWAYHHDGRVEERTALVQNFRLTKIPTMVGTEICNTYNKSREALQIMREDPKDPKCYFIKNGKEWVIDNIESMAFNQPRIFNNAWQREVQRLEFISKPGDTYQNSKQIVIRLMTNGAITIELATPNMRSILFPFYIVFRALGWATDREMFDSIMGGPVGYPDAPITQSNDDRGKLFRRMYSILEDAMHASYDTKNYKFGEPHQMHSQTEILRYLATHMPRDQFKDLDFEKEEHMQQAVTKILKYFDEDLFPHIGMEEHHRHTKLRFLGHLVNRMMYVHLGLLDPTDRDSYTTKRVHAAGISLGKAFKTHFNASIVNQIRKHFMKDFKAMSFHSVNLAQVFQISVNGADFERLLIQAIASSSSTLRVSKTRSVANRVSSQLFERKNYTKMLSTIRMINTPNSDSAKGSDRAKEMRMPTASAQGFICYTQSADHGEKVGLHKQLCIGSSVSSYDSGDMLKDTLLRDKERLRPWSEIHDYETPGLCKVFANGDLIGCCESASDYVYHYTWVRRHGGLSKYTTIEWNNNMNEVGFWVDYGRPIRPILIVYNNIRDWRYLGLKEPAKLENFRQGVALTEKHLRDLKSGKINMDDLRAAGIVEYLTPQEQVRMYVAIDINHLNQHEKDPLHQFTHCDNPETLLGLAALTGPLAANNQTTRNTFQSSQTRQTGGIYAHNWAHRIDKDTFLQYQVEHPLIYTRVNNYIPPNGANIIYAVACYTGYNEEDSTVWNKCTSERLKFNGSWFSYEKAELEKNEQFTNPDITQTSGIKSYANYKKLGKNGIVPIGTVVRKNDVLVGKVKRLPKNIAEEKKVNFIDASLVYKLEFPAIVHDIEISKDDEATTFCKIAFRSLKNITPGDKFSSRAGLTTFGQQK
jgi:DNA-directed RNA polymerase beta subunit